MTVDLKSDIEIKFGVQSVPSNLKTCPLDVAFDEIDCPLILLTAIDEDPTLEDTSPLKAGSLAVLKVPELILLALVASVVADVAKTGFPDKSL